MTGMRVETLLAMKRVEHQSEGIQLVEERLRLLNPASVAEKTITIHDLLDASGNALGTRVVIVLPVQQV